MGRRVAREEEGGESQTRQDRRRALPKTIEVLKLRVGYIKGRTACLTTKRSWDAKAGDGDVVELQLAHLNNSTVEGLGKKQAACADRFAHETDVTLGRLGRPLAESQSDADQARHAGLSRCLKAI
jgi:hypothetical protein